MDDDIGTILSRVDINDHDSELDAQEQAERDRELNGLLSNAFDDLSSVTDEDEDRTSDELNHNNNFSSPPPKIHDEPKLTCTSTPINAWNTKRPVFDEKSDEIRMLKDQLSRVQEDFNRFKLNATEFEKSSQINLNRLNQEIEYFKQKDVNTHKELQFYKNQVQENTALKSSLNEIRTDVEALTRNNSSLKEELRKEIQIQSLTAADNKDVTTTCNLIKNELEQCKQDNRVLVRKISSLTHEISKLRSERKEGGDCTSEQFKEMLASTTDLYKKELDEKFKFHLNDQITKAEKQLQENLKYHMLEAKDEWNNELSKQIQQIAAWLTSYLSTTEQPPQNELQAMLLPLQKLWISFRVSSNEILQDLTYKQQELKKAREELDDALLDSKINSDMNTSENSSRLISLRNELSLLNEQMQEMNSKLTKYKRKYFQTLEDHKRKIDDLKTDHQRQIETIQQEYVAILKKSKKRS